MALDVHSPNKAIKWAFENRANNQIRSGFDQHDAALVANRPSPPSIPINLSQRATPIHTPIALKELGYL